jgi:hypothetical protein
MLKSNFLFERYSLEDKILTDFPCDIAKEQLEKPFSREDKLKEKEARLNELNALLNVDKKENEIVDGDKDSGDDARQRSDVDRELR